MQETWVWPLVWEDPTSWGATKPMCQTTEAPAPKARAPQQREATTHRNWRESARSGPEQPKINKRIKLKKTVIYPSQPPFVSILNQKLPWMSMLLLSRFSWVRLCATPEMAAHQASPSLGFSRQEHWSGLPFPSPMHESEKWKWSRSVVPDS